jgi:HEAT repeat protein
MAEVFFSSDGLFSANINNIKAAEAAIHCVCVTDGEKAYSVLAHKVVGSWENGFGIHDVTERDIAIYRLDPDSLYEEPELDEYVPEEVDARRKNKEEEWAEEVRREIAAKKGKVEAEGSKTLSKRDAAIEDAREQQRMSESVIRKHVERINVRIGGVLKSILSMANAGKECGAHLSTLVPLVASVIGSQVVGPLANEVFCVLAKYSPDALRDGYRCSLPLALERMRTGNEGEEEFENCVWSCGEIFSACVRANKLMDPNSFSVIFSLVEEALGSDSVPASVVLDGVAILELQSTQAKGNPWGRMSCALLDAMNQNEGLVARCSGIICGMGAKFSELDLAKLLQRYTETPTVPCRRALLKTVEATPVVCDGNAPTSVAPLLWLTRFDPDGSLAVLAANNWTLSNCAPIPAENLLKVYESVVSSPDVWVRDAVGNAIAEIVSVGKPQTVDPLLADTFELYSGSSMERMGAAAVLAATGFQLNTPQLLQVMKWLLEVPLTSEIEEARSVFTACGATVVARAGSQAMDELWELLSETTKRLQEEEENATSKSMVEEKKRVQLSCVIFIASLASHMKADDARLLSILTLLLDSLAVSTESMQQAIAKHLPPLMAMLPEDQVQGYVTKLLKTIESSKERHERRGAAWGLAGLVKGRKLPALKKYGVLKGIERLLRDKKRAFAREGGLNLIECLVVTLGQGFEAYLIFLLQQLLDRYGDGSVDVRAAAEVTAKTIMGNLSSSGVRLVLGPLLKSLSGSDWRRKKGGVELLGSMAFISPTQLSSCLPAIVPVLTQILADTHMKVQEAAKEALHNIGGVISNPEIKKHVNLILKSFNDPDTYTEPLLRALLNTQFVHVLDAPSLALLMPAVTRALSFRDQGAKLMAVQIVGNIGSLTKPADLAPYLPSLSEELRNLLIDPSPDIRSTAAKAWGNLLRGMGEGKFPGLVQWLFGNFEQSPLESTRSGSAQGLGELLVSVPQERFDELIQEVMTRATHKSVGVRQGSLLTMAYLPQSDMGGLRLEPLLDQAFDLLLRSFSDESDEVRVAAFDAGVAMLQRFHSVHLDLFVPRIESGMFDASWRTRLACVGLLGELLSLCGGGRNGPDDGDDDDNTDSAVVSVLQEERLSTALGQERFDRVLASLYVCRCESNSTVKQKSLVVWKSSVVNPPRTIKRVMPHLMVIVVRCLGSANPELRETAGRTLGELVERLAEKVIPEMLPALTSKEGAPVETRQGSCLGLKYLVKSATKEQLVPFQADLVEISCKGLLDEHEKVREASTEAFSCVVEKCGKNVMDVVMTTLLEAASNDSLAAEDSLHRVSVIDPGKVVAVVVPKLLKVSPIPSWAIRVLALVAQSTQYYFSRVLGNVLPALAAVGSEEASKAALAIAESTPEEGMHLLVEKLVDLSRDEKPSFLVFSCTLMGQFTAKHELGSMDDYLDRFVEICLSMYLSKNEEVLSAACKAMKQLLGAIVPPSEERFIMVLKAAVHGLRFSQIKAGEAVGDIPGFNMPIGLSPVINLFKNGVMQGSPEIKESSAGAIVEVLRLCTPSCIKSATVMQLAPIIRILGEKVTPGVKKAILITLNVMLELVPLLLKALVPQFQTVFARALQDGDAGVRDEAAKALGRLMALNPRVDPLINELCGNILSSTSKVRHSMLLALGRVLKHAGKKVSATGLAKVLNVLQTCKMDVSINADEKTRQLTAEGFGAYASVCGDDDLKALMADCVSGGKSKEENVKDGNLLTLGSIALFLEHGEKLDPFIDDVLPLICAPANSIVVWRSKNKALFEWCIVNVRACPDNVPEMVKSMVASLAIDDRELRVEVLKLLKELAKYPKFSTHAVLDECVAPIMEKALDKRSYPVKVAAERALYHVLLKCEKSVLVGFLKKSDDQKQIQSYVTKVLSKMSEGSDDEEA